MDFSDALHALKEGRRVRRGIWENTWRGGYVELVPLWTQDNRQVMPVLMVGYPDQEILRPFAGSNWDLLADDWEVMDEE